MLRFVEKTAEEYNDAVFRTTETFAKIIYFYKAYKSPEKTGIFFVVPYRPPGHGQGPSNIFHDEYIFDSFLHLNYNEKYLCHYWKFPDAKTLACFYCNAFTVHN